MNFFEKEMRSFFGNQKLLQNARFSGKTCLARLDEELRIKLQLISTGVSNHYNAIRLSVINRTDGMVDQQTFYFADIIGKQLRNGMDAIAPHIWDDRGKPDWYIPITQNDRARITEAIMDYIELYQDEDIQMSEQRM